MMKKLVLFFACLTLVSIGHPAIAQEEEDSGEKAAAKKGGVISIDKRLDRLEKAITRDVEGDKWYDRIDFSGLVWVDAGFHSFDYDDGVREDEKASDIDLARMQLGVDAKAAKYVDGHIQFRWDNDDVGVYLEEGYIAMTGPESIPAYLIAGRQYIPFGNFASSFITDPTTFILGNTNEGAAVAGYRFGGKMGSVSLGVFNGEVGQTGEDDTIDSFVARINVRPNKGLVMGASYTSNLASSETLSSYVVTPDGTLDTLVGGFSVYLKYTFLERLTLFGEYVGASGKFQAGELYAAVDTENRQPAAWNTELGFDINDTWHVAARYGGSSDGGEMLHENEFGAVSNWSIFTNTNVLLEYLHGVYQDDVKTDDNLTLRLALSF